MDDVLQYSSKNSTLRFKCCVSVGFGAFFEGCSVLGFFYVLDGGCWDFLLILLCFFYIFNFSLPETFFKTVIKCTPLTSHSFSRCVFLVIVFLGGSLLLAKFILNLISVVKHETFFCGCKLLGHLV